MKGVILSGGTATRLFPLTATVSKQLLPVYNKQMIFYPLNTLIKAGIRDILMIVSPDNSGQYLNLLGSIFKNYGVNLYFEVQKVPGGLPEAFILGDGFIGSDNAALILGDNIFEDDFSDVVRNFKSGGHIFAKKVADPERSGVVKFDANGKAIEIREKPTQWLSDYAIPGFYIFDNQVVEVSKNLKPSGRGELEIVDLHNYYLNKNDLNVSIIEGAWLDAGTHDSLLEAGQIVKEKKISENFHPIINDAIEEFNRELKMRTKAILNMHNLQLREEFVLHKKA
ncbi:TPA: spore coat protein [Candidatus Moranbacteria bacterium]|nr:spore coat protein [Candidatus Moranbacteria bacterium]